MSHKRANPWDSPPPSYKVIRPGGQEEFDINSIEKPKPLPAPLTPIKKTPPAKPTAGWELRRTPHITPTKKKSFKLLPPENHGVYNLPNVFLFLPSACQAWHDEDPKLYKLMLDRLRFKGLYCRVGLQQRGTVITDWQAVFMQNLMALFRRVMWTWMYARTPQHWADISVDAPYPDGLRGNGMLARLAVNVFAQARANWLKKNAPDSLRKEALKNAKRGLRPPLPPALVLESGCDRRNNALERAVAAVIDEYILLEIDGGGPQRPLEGSAYEAVRAVWNSNIWRDTKRVVELGGPTRVEFAFDSKYTKVQRDIRPLIASNGWVTQYYPTEEELEEELYCYDKIDSPLAGEWTTEDQYGYPGPDSDGWDSDMETICGTASKN